MVGTDQLLRLVLRAWSGCFAATSGRSGELDAVRAF
jgi:hypothetical protein